jgi:hypothetical protein
VSIAGIDTLPSRPQTLEVGDDVIVGVQIVVIVKTARKVARPGGRAVRAICHTGSRCAHESEPASSFQARL